MTKDLTDLTDEQLDEWAELVIRQNEMLLAWSRRRSDWLQRAAQESERIVERAVRQLRTGRY